MEKRSFHFVKLIILCWGRGGPEGQRNGLHLHSINLVEVMWFLTWFFQNIVLSEHCSLTKLCSNLLKCFSYKMFLDSLNKHVFRYPWTWPRWPLFSTCSYFNPAVLRIMFFVSSFCLTRTYNESCTQRIPVNVCSLYDYKAQQNNLTWCNTMYQLPCWPCCT